MDSQHGLWPAIWAFRDPWPGHGEIDFVEDYGWNTIQTSVHTPDGRGGVHTEHADLTSAGGWHVYSMDWSPAEAVFCRDGTEYLTVTSSMPRWGHLGAMYIVINLAVGGAAGSPASATFPAELLVDYVRIRE